MRSCVYLFCFDLLKYNRYTLYFRLLSVTPRVHPVIIYFVPGVHPFTCEATDNRDLQHTGCQRTKGKQPCSTGGLHTHVRQERKTPG